MKKKGFNKKLALNKKTIVNLNKNEMRTMKVGGTWPPDEPVTNETWCDTNPENCVYSQNYGFTCGVYCPE